MIHKIGLNKCREKKINYFNTLLPTHMVEIEGTEGTINIVSLMVDQEIVEMKTLREESTRAVQINVVLALTYKMLYTTEEDRGIHIVEKTFYNTQMLNIPAQLEGASVYQMLQYKKEKVNVYIEDVTVKQLTNQLAITPYIILTFDYPLQYTLAYCMAYNEGQNNLFIAKAGGKNCTQKTFDYGIHYKQIFFGLGNGYVGYLTEEEKNKVYLIHTDSSLTQVVELPVQAIEEVSFVDEEQFVCIARQGEVMGIYKYHIGKKQVEQLMVAAHDSRFEKLTYHHQTEKLYGVKVNPTESILFSIDTIHFDQQEVGRAPRIKAYVVQDEGEYIVMVEQREEGQEMLYLVEQETKRKQPLPTFYGEGSCQQLVALVEQSGVLFVIEQEARTTIYTYELRTKQWQSVLDVSAPYKIGDVCMNSLGDTLYYTTNERGKYDVYALELESQEHMLIQSCQANYITIVHKIF